MEGDVSSNSKSISCSSVNPCAYKCIIAILVNSETTIRCIFSIVRAKRTSICANVALPDKPSVYPKNAFGIFNPANNFSFM